MLSSCAMSSELSFSSCFFLKSWYLYIIEWEHIAEMCPEKISGNICAFEWGGQQKTSTLLKIHDSRYSHKVTFFPLVPFFFALIIFYLSYNIREKGSRSSEQNYTRKVIEHWTRQKMNTCSTWKLLKLVISTLNVMAVRISSIPSNVLLNSAHIHTHIHSFIHSPTFKQCLFGCLFWCWLSAIIQLSQYIQNTLIILVDWAIQLNWFLCLLRWLLFSMCSNECFFFSVSLCIF